MNALERAALRAPEAGPVGLAGEVRPDLLRDEVLAAKIDGWIERLVVYASQEYRHQFGQLIAHTVSKWDADVTSTKIELQIGRDLQFIRINGTVVGGLAGLVIYGVSLLLR